MRLSAAGAPHLTYCTNVHPGESWAEVRANLEKHVLAVKGIACPDRDFGVGLRLSARAAEELEEPGALEELRAFLDREQLYVFTLNGFPHGTFHGTRVKEAVYRPDWAEAERVVYSDRLARLLAKLLPEEKGLTGSISTLPGAFRERARSDDEHEAIARGILDHVATLIRIREQSGKHLVLALEPEPHCFLETTEEAIRFFERSLFRTPARRYLAKQTGLDAADLEERIRDHVGVCLDTCHAAVEFENPVASLEGLRAAEIRLAKAQLSVGLRVEHVDDESLAALEPFARDAVYLHQVVERSDGQLRRFLDLPAAIAEARDADLDLPREWRVHFHTPIFHTGGTHFGTTQPFLAKFLELIARDGPTRHLEVETYTWDVLPAEFHGEELASAIARELAWARERLEP